MSETAYYLLNELGNAVKASDMDEWLAWRETDDERQYLRSATYTIEGKDRIEINTLFLVATPVFCSCAELFGDQACCDCRWSTNVYSYAGIIMQLVEQLSQEMKADVFVSDCYLMRRYKTKQEAIKGHAVMCQFVEACMPRLKMPEEASEE